MTDDVSIERTPKEVVFPRGSEVAERMRHLDWSKTDLGVLEAWPHTLRVAIGLCLTSRMPMVLCWGPALSVIYNDAYVSFLGEPGHDTLLGRPARECWPEIWDTIGPMLRRVYETGLATSSDDLQMFSGLTPTIRNPAKLLGMREQRGKTRAF